MALFEFRVVLCRALSVGLVSVPSLAFAGAPTQVEALEQTPLIQGGQSASQCQWPTTVSLFNGSGLCSGTLVHPRVVTSAAHCMAPMFGGYPNSVRFGEQTFEPAFEVDVDFCLYNPGWTNEVGPSDYAFCVLSEAVDLPPTPPLMGCELEQLELGTEVALVGFGDSSDNGGAGTKRWGMSTIEADMVDDTILAGNMDVSTCSGDSGGTGYYQLPDGGWRSWGMLSGGPEGCGNYGIYVNIAAAAAWIEEQSGYDITPCHDADGTWNPGPDCEGTASNPTAGGSWNQGCPGEVGEEPATCGPGNSWPEDLTPPQAEFVVPIDGEVYPDSPTSFDITVETQDDGFAVVAVELYIDGEYATERTRPAWEAYEPWVFANAEFFNGSYALTARAIDYAGNVGESQPVTFHIGEAPGDGDGDPAGDGDGDASGDGDGDPDAGETGETGTEPSETDTGDEGLPAMPIDPGCACGVDGAKPPKMAFLLPLLLLGLRRRE